MGNRSTNPQAPTDYSGNPSLQLSQSMPISNVTPMIPPNQNSIQNPNGPDESTLQLARNMNYLQNTGAFETPYQKAMQNHPILMGLANGMQAFGQGLTHQPFYTANQENQASLQNTQQQGINSMVAMPAQMRMQMMMFHPELFGGIPPAAQQPQNVPGIPQQVIPTVIKTPGMPTNAASLPPQLLRQGASTVLGGVPYVRDAQGNWTPQGGK